MERVTLDAVVKVGGSLLDSDGLPALMESLGELAASLRILVVPGGGPFADAVRRACQRQEPGESAAHWMAILAMDQHAQLLYGLEPRGRLVVGPEDIAATVTKGRLAILAPFAWLRSEDPMPHGWHVTSDSIAAWVAAQLRARRLVLLKSVEGARDEGGTILAEASTSTPGVKSLVDDYFPQVLESGLECWVLSGRHPERVGELLRTGRAPGTRLHRA
jgi:5-(aminomethyl)-3-furanmethanol phosphate kinase